MLAESAQRLLWMYHRCLPSVVAEARFDVGKLLLNFSVRSSDEKVEMEKEDGMEVEGEEGKDEDEEPGAAVRLHRVQQLHVLKILKESDQFVWAGKAGTHSSPPSSLALHNLINHLRFCTSHKPLHPPQIPHYPHNPSPPQRSFFPLAAPPLTKHSFPIRHIRTFPVAFLHTTHTPLARRRVA